jgi:hypothetical protein
LPSRMSARERPDFFPDHLNRYDPMIASTRFVKL